MSEKINLVCIVCPVGCQLEVTKDNDNITVTGNGCKRGVEYAKNEITNPTRVLTTTVTVENAKLNRIPVKTKGEIPKGLLFDAMILINNVILKAPVKVGDIVVENILDTGVDVVASRSLERQRGDKH